MNTQFENDNAFENATLMLEVCRGAFERGGFQDEAKQLRGLEATSRATAYASMHTLRAVQSRNGETASTKRYALTALRAVVYPHIPSNLPLAG